MMITNSDYQLRIKKLQERCKKNGLDAFLITSEDNLYYITGKSCFPFERPFIVIIWTNKPPTYFLPRLELEHISVIPHIDDFVTYYEYPAPEKDSWPYVLGQLLNDCTKIGTDLYTRSEIFSFLGKKFEVEAYDWVYTMRYIKSDSELALMRKAAEYTRESMLDFLKNIRYGSIVLDSLNPAKKAQKKAFIDNKFIIDFLSSKFISAAWPAPKSSEPHSIPNPLSEFKDGPHVVVLSYRLDGYAIELERTFFTSQPTKEMREYFEHMMKAREIAFSMCKPGVASADIDDAVRNYLIDNGLVRNIIHRVGHGMGVSNHEGPFIAVGSNTILEEGMTFTIEPGIYFKGLGAFRHSDTILITKDGYENLTDVPDDIDSMIIDKKRGLVSLVKQSFLKRLIKN